MDAAILIRYTTLFFSLSLAACDSAVQSAAMSSSCSNLLTEAHNTYLELVKQSFQLSNGRAKRRQLQQALESTKSELFQCQMRCLGNCTHSKLVEKSVIKSEPHYFSDKMEPETMHAAENAANQPLEETDAAMSDATQSSNKIKNSNYLKHESNTKIHSGERSSKMAGANDDLTKWADINSISTSANLCNRQSSLPLKSQCTPLHPSPSAHAHPLDKDFEELQGWIFQPMEKRQKLIQNYHEANMGRKRKERAAHKGASHQPKQKKPKAML